MTAAQTLVPDGHTASWRVHHVAGQSVLPLRRATGGASHGLTASWASTRRAIPCPMEAHVGQSIKRVLLQTQYCPALAAHLRSDAVPGARLQYVAVIRGSSSNWVRGAAPIACGESSGRFWTDIDLRSSSRTNRNLTSE